MKYENMNLKQAWLYLKERRRIIMPNAGKLSRTSLSYLLSHLIGFLRQLIEFETKVLSLPPSLALGRYGQLNWLV
jgi:hypothetical protein